VSEFSPSFFSLEVRSRSLVTLPFWSGCLRGGADEKDGWSPPCPRFSRLRLYLQAFRSVYSTNRMGYSSSPSLCIRYRFCLANTQVASSFFFSLPHFSMIVLDTTVPCSSAGSAGVCIGADTALPPAGLTRLHLSLYEPFIQFPLLSARS